MEMKNKNILSIVAIVLSVIAIIFSFIGGKPNSYRVLIGSADEIAGYTLKDKRQVLTIVTRVFKENNQGFTMTTANGSYIDSNNKFHGEETYIIDINDVSESKFKKILVELVDNLNTGQVMVEELNKKVYLFPDKVEYEAEPEY